MTSLNDRTAATAAAAAGEDSSAPPRAPTPSTQETPLGADAAAAMQGVLGPAAAPDDPMAVDGLDDAAAVAGSEVLGLGGVSSRRGAAPTGDAAAEQLQQGLLAPAAAAAAGGRDAAAAGEPTGGVGDARKPGADR